MITLREGSCGSIQIAGSSAASPPVSTGTVSTDACTNGTRGGGGGTARAGRFNAERTDCHVTSLKFGCSGALSSSATTISEFEMETLPGSSTASAPALTATEPRYVNSASGS